MNNNYYDEDVIDLKDLIKYIANKWRHILIALIVGLLLGTLFSLYKTTQNNVQNQIKSMENNIDEINVSNVNKYHDVKNMYEEALDYNKNSVMMSLDYNNVFVRQQKYAIITDNYGVDSLKQYLENELKNKNNWASIEKEYSEYNINDLLDLIYYNNEVATLDSSKYNDNLTLGVYSNSEDMTNKIADKCDEIINNYFSRVRTEATKISDNITFGFSNDLKNKQIAKNDLRTSLLNTMTNIKASFNKYEDIYYNYNYDYDNFVKNNTPQFSKKWPLLFGVAFSILAVGLYFLKYLFDSHIKTEEEINNKYQLSTLATIGTNKEKTNVIDKLINNINKVNTNDYNYLKSVIKNLGNKKILLCNEFDEFNEDLKKLDKRLVVCGTLDNDEKAIDTLKSVDGVILTNRYWKTTNSRLQKQIDILKKNNKEIIGVINYL